MARVLVIVTLVSPNGEYGGPLRVAVNQAKALIDRGHKVVIAGAVTGFPHIPTDIDGVPAKLFPARRVLPRIGFSGLTAPGLIRWLHGHVSEHDAVHVHLARDLVTLPAAGAALVRNVHYVVQPHGMIDSSDRKLASVLDACLTRRVLRGASAVLHLTPKERDDLLEVDDSLDNLVELPNGVPLNEPTPNSTGGTDTSHREVLYLARLAPRKRPLMFVEVATKLAHHFRDVRFTLVGPDEGEAKDVQKAIDDSGHRGQVRWEGPLPPDQTIARMRRAAVYVLPAIDEPYPMTVLEAMSVGLPVVVTRSCGLADLVERSDAGIVVEEDASSLLTAVKAMLENPEAARAMGRHAMSAVREEQSMDCIATRLEKCYLTESVRTS
jgi:glycosyltransferase involved in cell wall biosynthesis